MSKGVGVRGVLVLGLVGLLFGALSEHASAAPWCGSVSDVDRPAVTAGYPIRVLYAHAADGADRSAEVAPRIHADIEEITSWWLREDSSRSPRFDLAAFACGSQVDVGRLRVPRSASELSDTRLAFQVIRDAVFALPGSWFTKFLVYYDGPTGGRECGRGGGVPNGVGTAVVFVGACAGLPTTGTAAHELLHAMGAVPAVAGPPGACPDDRGHVCDSSGDAMYPFIQAAPITSLQLDVGRNDYYGHEGAWLDVQDSFWLHRNDQRFVSHVAVRGGAGRVTSDVPGLDCTAVCRVEWSPGTRIVLTAVAAAGSRFVRWEGACEERADTCQVDLTENRSVTAVFGPPTFRLSLSVAGRGTVTSTPGGISCPRRCAGSFESFEPVFLIARPAKGWRFKAWSGACRGRATECAVPLDRSRSARATFVRR